MLSQKIKNVRRQRGLTQERLARLAGISYVTLTKIERNIIKNPRVSTVVRIAGALETSIDRLLTGSAEQ